jgi:thiamine pyrophosphate-dependent acetolactate synthase large subunit-like protein
MNQENNLRILSGGQAVVESFKTNDIKFVFGLIGSETMELFDALLLQ